MWQAIKNYFAEFKILKMTPKEFWILNMVVNFFEMLSYFAFITILSLYLTHNLGFDDVVTGQIMGWFSLGITLVVFFAGPIIDTIGIKKALVISMAILIPTRFFMGSTDFIERYFLSISLDENAAVEKINEKEYWKKAFTAKAEKFTAAQADIVMAQPDAAKKGYTSEKLRDDAQTLRKETVKALASSQALIIKWQDKLSEAVQKRIGELEGSPETPEKSAKIEQAKEALKGDFERVLAEASKDVAIYKEVVADFIGENPKLSAKYYYQLDRLTGKERRGAIIETIIAFPELRREFTINEALKWIVYLMLALIAIGEGLMVPAIYVAVRRFTNKRTSGAGFNFQYLSMNVGAILSFALMDAARNYFGPETGNSIFFLMAAGFAVICTVGALIMRTAIEVKDDGEIVHYESEEQIKAVGGGAKENPIGIIIGVVKETAFWRFMLFITLLVGVKLVFTHQFMVMPKYYDRVGHGSIIGLLNTINPTIIVIGLVLFIPIIAKFSVFRLIVIGTFVSSLSVFILVLPGKFFTLFGWTIEQGYFFIILAQIIIFAFGEIIWSPRLSEYTVTIAPKGREGTYMSLAALPMFIAKPLNGFISGYLLDAFCPEDVMSDIVTGVRGFWNGPEMMWLIFGLISISSPVLVLLLRNVIRGEEKEEKTVLLKEGESAKIEATNKEGAPEKEPAEL
ncbi:MAG: hypothetical protein Kow0090_00130 [Myxococcota bacterium]